MCRSFLNIRMHVVVEAMSGSERSAQTQHFKNHAGRSRQREKGGTGSWLLKGKYRWILDRYCSRRVPKGSRDADAS